MKYNGLLLSFCMFSIFCFGQSPKTGFVNLGYDRIGQNNFIKAGYKVALNDFGEFETNFSTFSVDLGYSFVENKSCYSPSLTYNFYGLFYYLGASANYFIRNNEQEFRISPQIGLTYFNVLNIGYSYYLPLSNEKKIKDIGSHSFNISISIPMGFLNSASIYNNHNQNKTN